MSLLDALMGDTTSGHTVVEVTFPSSTALTTCISGQTFHLAFCADLCPYQVIIKSMALYIQPSLVHTAQRHTSMSLGVETQCRRQVVSSFARHPLYFRAVG